MPKNLQDLVSLRQALHREPEISNFEEQTAHKIAAFLTAFQPQQMIEHIGGHGLMAIFQGTEIGPTILIRCELDALPIPEELPLRYRSKYPQVSHKCGHDGHMAIVAGLAPSLQKLSKGRVILLFQPAEETGEGAIRMLQDAKMHGIFVDYAFALHNLPGYPLHSILVKEGSFNAASKGMIVTLKGLTSHAAEPEKGINPSIALAEIIQELHQLSLEKDKFNNFTLITVIHALLGEISFGTSPGNAELRFTLRAFENEDMRMLSSLTVSRIMNIVEKKKIAWQVNWTDEFAATVNDPHCVQIIREVALKENFSLQELDQPFKWSEDFGQFTKKYKGAIFGLGAGLDHPALHNPNYDFPDEIIETGIRMFEGIIQKILS
ncbi:MAG: amidohydrolase [Microscillaceae bacterium]|nr:amidohydrolase [Microscillaceae bacterium]